MSWDFSEDDLDTEGGLPEGVYLAEIASAESRQSQAGDAMVNIALSEVGSRRHICYDNLMMNGRGAGIGVKKALSLGIAERYKEEGEKRVRVSPPEHWKGHRAVVTVIMGEYKGKKRLEVDFGADGFGYAPEDTWDPSRTPEAPPPDDPDDTDIPF